jgi:hypothetical protein
MSIIEYTANTVRALMAAEIAIGSVNCGSRFVTRGHAERLLNDYFSLVEQAIPWDDHNSLDRRS